MSNKIKICIVALVCMIQYRAGADTVTIKQKDRYVTIANKTTQIKFNLRTGKYSGKNLQSNLTMFKNAKFQIDPSPTRTWREPKTTYTYEQKNIIDKLGTGKTLEIIHTPHESYDPIRILTITIYEDKPFVVLGFAIKNQFAWELRICDALVLNEGELFINQQPKNPKVLRGGAGAERNIVKNSWQIDALNSAMLTYKNKKQRETIVAGGLKYKEYIRNVKLKQNKNKKQMTLKIWDPQGKRVPANTTWYSQDSFYLDFVTKDPFTSLENFGLAMRTINNAKPNNYNFPTLCGWMVSTKRFGEGKPINNSPGLVKQVDIAKKSGILKYTPVAVRLEPDAYCYTRQGNTQQGWWDDKHWAMYIRSLRPPYETFEKFCQAVQKRGGITFTYFQGSLPSNDFATAHPNWMLNNDISRIHVDHAHHRPIIRYDYTDHEFQAYVLKMWKRLRRNGMKGIKFDYPETAWARYGGFEDKTYTTSSAYRKLFELAREGLGKDAYLHERALGGSVHESVPRVDLTAGVVDLQRVWSDSSHFEPEMASRIGLRWYKNRVVFSYYPDGKSLYIPKTHNPLPTDKRRTLLTLIGLLSGRLELGTSFGSMTPQMIHDISRLYPMFSQQKSPRPVDMLLNKKDPETYVYQVNKQWLQIILFNAQNKAKTISVPLAGNQADTGSLGLDTKAQYYIYDFWNNKYIGLLKGTDTLSRPLKANEALVYSVHKKLSHPQFISTNRHIMQGMMELHNVSWNKNNKQYQGQADVIAGETMEIIIAPNNYKFPTVTVDAGTATINKTKDGLLILKIDSKENKTILWKLQF